MEKGRQLILILLGLMAPQLVVVAQGQGEDAQSNYKGFAKGYCTYYAAREFDKVASDPGQNWRGNASAWVANAAAKGWRTSTEPREAKVNALIVWNDGGFGHVGVVENVNGGTILISEMNWGKIIDKDNAITTNFDKVTQISLKTSNLNRGTDFRFSGYIFPEPKAEKPKVQKRFVVHLTGNETWLDTGIRVGRGQLVDIVAAGQVVWNPNTDNVNTTAGPEGVNYNAYALSQPEDFPMPKANVACLLVRIGTMTYAVGRGLSVPVQQDGTVRFMINDRYNGLEDNYGDLSITVQLLP